MTVERVRVKDILQLQRRAVVVDPGETYRLIGIYSFGKGIFHRDPQLGARLGNFRYFAVRSGDLVLSNIQAWEGAIAHATDVDAETIGTHRFLTYTAIDERVDTNWLRWFLLSEPGMELIRRASPGTTMRNRTLAIQRFENLEIPLPAIDEQRRIATALCRIRDRLCELGPLDEHRSRIVDVIPLAVHHEAQRRCRLTAQPLGEVLEQVRQPIEIDPLDTYVTMGIRSFGKGIFHYPRRPGSAIGKLRFFSVEPGVLAISNIKAWEGAVATTSVAEAEVIASNRFLFFRPVAGEEATDYFWSLLLNPEGLAALGHASPGSADRNRTLAVDRFLKLTLPIAEARHQRAIGRRVREARALAARCREKSASMRERTDALLSAALNEAFADFT